MLSDFQVNDGVLVKYLGQDREVSVPAGIRKIRGGAFSGNANIRKVTVPSDVVTIGKGAFAGCRNLVCVCVLGIAIEIGNMHLVDVQI